MFIFFVICATLMWIFGFAARISFCFKEEYKKHYSNLFEEGGFHRPYNWGISRQTNHDIYVKFKCFTWLFAFVSIVSGVFVCDILPLIAIITVPFVIVLPLGETIGIHLCRILVRKQCKKFEIPYPKLQSELPWLKKSSWISVKIFVLL